MTDFQKRLTIGVVIVVVVIALALLAFFMFKRAGSSQLDLSAKSQAESLYGRLDRTIKKIEQKESEVKNNAQQAYTNSKETKAYLDSLKKSRKKLEAYRKKVNPLLKEEDANTVLTFLAQQVEIDSTIEQSDLTYLRFHNYQIAEKDETIEEQAEEIKKYKRLTQKYRSLYTNLHADLAKADTIIMRLEAKIDSINHTQSTQLAQSSNRADSLAQALHAQKQLAAALRDSVNRFPQFEIIKLLPTPYEAKNFKKSDHWNLNHIEKNGFFVDLQLENFKHKHDTVQLRIIVDVPVGKKEYKELKAEVVYNFKTNTHDKIEFFPKDLRNGVINFSVYWGNQFLRLETMRIRKPSIFSIIDEEVEEGKKNIDPSFED